MHRRIKMYGHMGVRKAINNANIVLISYDSSI